MIYDGLASLDGVKRILHEVRTGWMPNIFFHDSDRSSLPVSTDTGSGIKWTKTPNQLMLYLVIDFALESPEQSL